MRVVPVRPASPHLLWRKRVKKRNGNRKEFQKFYERIFLGESMLGMTSMMEIMVK